ncbi:hypothetical protein, partial [Enterocloster citroniae]|uniref:hypothetical protein n=1 Tax=Enterocloster citroniae TaxID=358743 RepID=UPI00349ECD3A
FWITLISFKLFRVIIKGVYTPPPLPAATLFPTPRLDPIIEAARTKAITVFNLFFINLFLPLS